MKKLIVNLVLSLFLTLISFAGMSATTCETGEFVVPAVLYKGEIIPVVHLPVVEILEYTCSVKATNTTPKGDSNRYGPKNKMRKHTVNS